MKIKAFVLLIVASFFGLHSSASAQSLAALSYSDRASIESACNYSKVIEGAAAYHTCLNNQLRELGNSKAPSLAALSYSDRASIESACNYSKVIEGAAAYHTCLNNQLRELGSSKAPSLAALSYSDRASIESACNYSKVIKGAAAYHTCLDNQLRELGQVGTSAVAQRRRSTIPACAGLGCTPATAFAPQPSLTTIPTCAGLGCTPAITVALPRVPSIPATTTGLCAENGSCYGDISAATGLPKTVAVSGVTLHSNPGISVYWNQ